MDSDFLRFILYHTPYLGHVTCCMPGVVFHARYLEQRVNRSILVNQRGYPRIMQTETGPFP